MATGTTVTAKILADVTNFSTGMKKASTSLSKFSAAATRAGRDITTSISAPLILLGREAVRVGTSFDLAQRKIQGIRGAEKPIAKLVKTARELGASTIFTAEEVSALQLSLAKLGKTDNEILALQGSILKLAQAMDIDLAEAGELVVKNQNRFRDSLQDLGGDLEQATFITNVFAKATQSSLLTAETLGVALNYSASEAAAYGISLSETVAILGLLADQGFEASRGGTSFRRILGQLAKDGLNAEQALAALFDSTKGYAAELEQFGLRGAGARKSLADLLPLFDELKNKLNNSEGTVDKFADALDESLLASFRRLQSALADFAIELEEQFGDNIKEIVESLTRFVRSLSEMDTQTKRTIGLTLAFLAALGPLLLIIGGLTSGIALAGRVVAGLGFKFLRARVVMRQLGAELGFVASSFNAQVFAARASAIATGKAGAAAVKTSARFATLGKALRFTGYAIAIEGILTLIDKVNRALGEGDRLAEASLKDAALQLEVDAEIKSLDELDFSEIERRVRAGAAQLTLDFMDGISPVPVDEIANRLVPVGVAEAIEKRAQEIIASGVNLFGEDPFTIAINQYFAAIAAKRKEDLKQQKIDDGTITNIDKLITEYTELKNKILELKSAAVSGKDVDFEYVEDLEKRFGDVGEQISQLGLKGVESFDKLRKNAPLEPLKRLNSEGEKVSGTLETMTDDEAAKRLAVAFAGVSDVMPELQTGANAASESIDKLIEKVTQEELLANVREIEALAVSIGGIFENAFKSALDGTESLSKAIRNNLVDAIKSLIAKLAALAVAWGIVALLATIATGGSNLGKAAGAIKAAGFGNFLMEGMGLSSFSTKSTQQGGGLKVQGILSGSDISLSTKRGVTANDRIYG